MKYFLFDAEDLSEIAPEDGKELTLEKAIEVFYHLSEEDGSFFGLQNTNETVLQFSWENDSEWLVDIPLNKTKTYQKYCDFDECVNIIKSFYKKDDVPRIYSMQLTDI